MERYVSNRRHSFNDTGPNTDPRRIEEARARQSSEMLVFHYWREPEFKLSQRLKLMLARLRD
jgi:hypothetical protein